MAQRSMCHPSLRKPFTVVGKVEKPKPALKTVETKKKAEAPKTKKKAKAKTKEKDKDIRE